MIELRPAQTLSIAARAALLNAAYVDYLVPLHVTADQLDTMDAFYDVDLARSIIAFSGDRPVGMTCLSLRGERGWISAVGVIPEWRQHGIARQMLRQVMTHAQAAGICVLLLEVIDHNERARRLYETLRFKPRRELLTWRFAADAGPLPIPEQRLFELSPNEALNLHAAWHTVPPSWQRELPTLRRMSYGLKAFRLDLNRDPAAYCLINDHGEGVSILDVGLNPEYGPVAAGRILLQALWFLYRGRVLTMLNVPADDGLSRALAALHFLVTIRQIEMSVDCRK